MTAKKTRMKLDHTTLYIPQLILPILIQKEIGCCIHILQIFRKQ